ncbi:hypothetical protein [Bacillus thermotolerans]|uniref:hypothetical protein n=1 Tax=Bacillus thermotolerans TaxID=1221996 RepID=UPI0005895066|nr:hypothetical protein [Bacillus thermotolerans]
MGHTEHETKRYTDFSKDDIKKYLNDFKQLVRDGAYSIELNENRTENVDFMEEYDISTEKAKDILLCLDVLDFCYAADNRKPRFAHEKLYVFCKECELDNRGTIERVDIYIKSNMTKTKRGSILFIVSFHKRNKPISYCFK